MDDADTELAVIPKDLPGVNELQFVDDDLAAIFRGKAWMMGTPTMIQLSRDLRALTEELREARLE
jgi:hypothetical protein